MEYGVWSMEYGVNSVWYMCEREGIYSSSIPAVPARVVVEGQ
jgi:hypothetical protein